MEAPSKRLLLSVAALALLSFALGRYTVPTKTTTEKETDIVQHDQKQTTEKTDTQTDKDRVITKTTTERTNPDGTKEVVTQVKDETKTHRQTDTVERTKQTTETDESIKQRTTVERGGSQVNLSVLGGIPASSLFNPTSVEFGVCVSREILGPITVGAFGFKSGLVGLALGLNL